MKGLPEIGENTVINV